MNEHGVLINIIAPVLSFIAGIVAAILSQRSAVQKLIENRTRHIIEVLTEERNFWREKYFAAESRIKQLEVEVTELRYEVKRLEDKYGLAG